jgi:hypothetical protein
MVGQSGGWQRIAGRVPEWITPRRGEKRDKRKQARGGEAEEKRYRHPLRSAVHGDVT